MLSVHVLLIPFLAVLTLVIQGSTSTLQVDPGLNISVLPSQDFNIVCQWQFSFTLKFEPSSNPICLNCLQKTSNLQTFPKVFLSRRWSQEQIQYKLILVANYLTDNTGLVQFLFKQFAPLYSITILHISDHLKVLELLLYHQGKERKKKPLTDRSKTRRGSSIDNRFSIDQLNQFV